MRLTRVMVILMVLLSGALHEVALRDVVLHEVAFLEVEMAEVEMAEVDVNSPIILRGSPRSRSHPLPRVLKFLTMTSSLC